MMGILSSCGDEVRTRKGSRRIVACASIIKALVSSIAAVMSAVDCILVTFMTVSLIMSSVVVNIVACVDILRQGGRVKVLETVNTSGQGMSRIFGTRAFVVKLYTKIVKVKLALLLLVPKGTVVRGITSGTGMGTILPVIPTVVLVLLDIILALLNKLVPSGGTTGDSPIATLHAR